MNLSAHARRQVQQRAGETIAKTFPTMAAADRRVLTALLVRTAEGWRLFARRSSTGEDGPTAEAFLVGPSGVFAVLISDGVPKEATQQAVARHAEERCAGIRGSRGQVVARSAVHLVLVLSGGRTKAGDTRLFRTLTEVDVDKLFRRAAVHLDRGQVGAIAHELSRRLPDYVDLSVRPPEHGPRSVELLDAEDLTADQVAAAQQRPFSTWLTFLHPHQQAVVTRNYNGPARISGPAGTGKTVVALHRLRHLGRRTTGPLLFTTFVRTLPLVHQASFHLLAPELADRAEFTNLHSWARGFLASRDRHVEINPAQATTAFNRAWVLHREELQVLEPNPGYWQTEIDRVIKGRGVTTFQDYAKLSRRGRSVRLDVRQKERVWRLYSAYQEILREKGLHDYNDMISIALDEVRERPLDERYAAVVVDEVQDITLTGLKLLREVAGDGPNRLLLVGDGQQAVYAGGWRLSDADIPVQGRGEVLRVNYRNRVKVLDFASTFGTTNHVDDLDGAAGVALRDAECTISGGEVRTWRGPEHDLPAALLAAVRDWPFPLGRTALIAFTKRDLDRCTAVLREAGIPLVALQDYEGEQDDRLKIGTVHRAKGLDFQAVLVVQSTHPGGQGREPEEEQVALRDRQHLVAATRARDLLWWGVVA
jgi:hypothetical protein